MTDTTDLETQFKELQRKYLDSLKESCDFFEDSLSFLQTGCLDNATFASMELEATKLTGSGKSYGFACISDAADLLLSMLKHLKNHYREDIALPIIEQEHLAVFTLALLIVLRKVRSEEIHPETLQIQSLYFNHTTSSTAPPNPKGSATDNVIKLNTGVWAGLRTPTPRK